MTEDPSSHPQLTPEELLTAQILHEEKGKQVDFTALHHLEQFKPGDIIRIYRLADRDIKHGRAAVLEMKLIKIDRYNWKLTFEGKYISSDRTSETVDIPSGTLIISVTGQTLQIFADKLAKHLAGLHSQWLLFKRTDERVLIFVEKDDAGALKNIGDAIRRVLDRVLKALSPR